MNFNNLIFIFIFCTNSIFAQQSIDVEYCLVIEPIEKNYQIDRYSKMASEGAKDITFVLNSNSKKSRFSLVKNPMNNTRNSKIAIGWADYSNTIYSNLELKRKYQNNAKNLIFDNDEFLINDQMYIDWNLKDDTKRIMHYVCYKAKGQYIAENKQYNIIAWYCPEIPYSSGPMGFGGLPGIILDLQINEVKFGAIKITETPYQEIIIPKKGKNITKSEYIQLFENSL